MMGPKDYNAIAGKIKVMCKYALTHREKQMLLGVAQEIADYCRSQSIKFQRDRFMDATGTKAFMSEFIE